MLEQLCTRLFQLVTQIQLSNELKNDFFKTKIL